MRCARARLGPATERALCLEGVRKLRHLPGTHVVTAMDVRSRIGMVFHIDKCIGCHTCSIACKNVRTDRPGTEYMRRTSPMATKKSARAMPKPPKTYDDFVARFPGLSRAWDAMRAAGVSAEEIEQTAALSASTIGVPGAGAAWSWIRKSLDG
jgi:ferredoxin